MSSSSQVEFEFKLSAALDLDPAEVLTALTQGVGVHCSAPRARTQRDVYLDDRRHHLTQAGVGLRLRTVDGTSALNWKDGGTAEGGWYARHEVERDWQHPTPPEFASELPEHIRDRVEPLVFRRRLRPLVELETHRVVAELSQGGDRAELAIDHVRVFGKDGPHTFAEIEIEAKVGAPEAAQRWAAQLGTSLGLEPARHDKLHRALAFHGITGRSAIDTDVGLGPDAPIGLAAEVYLREHFDRLQHAEIATRVDGTPGAVHRLRVACRRLRAALRALRRELPGKRERRARRALGSTAAAFGAARDLDVFLGWLSNDFESTLPDRVQRAGTTLLDRLELQRERALDRGVEYLRDPERLRRLQKIQNALERPLRRRCKSRDTAAQCATRVLNRGARAVAKADPDSNPHDYTTAVKRLRYAAEVFQGALEVELADYVRDLTWLQDAHCALRDSERAEAQLLALATRQRGHEDGLLALGAWLGVTRQRRRGILDAVDEARAVCFDLTPPV